ncbi:MAG: hemolysin family protein [Gemmatimonadaceae bacterium]
MSAWLIIAAVSVLFAALLAAADGALLTTGHSAPTPLIGDPERAHRALALGRVLAHLMTGTAIALAVSRLALRPATGLALAVGLLLLNVTFVEGVARLAGFARGMSMLHRLAPVVAVADLLFLPLSWFGQAVEGVLSRAMPPADESSTQREAEAEQFREVVAAEADVSKAEEDLLHGVFSLRDTEVKEIMVPRVDVVGIEKSTPWSEVLDRMRSSEHARFPVYEETLDNVVGIIYAKDLLKNVVAGHEPDDWSVMVRPASFIPATKTIDRQLRDFKAQRTHIAIVSDEFGGTAGLVTIEDVLEEIVGDIRDEYDVEEPEIVQEENERFWIAARVTLADLSELLGFDFQREDITTVGGLVYDSFGRVPKAGESATIASFRVVVERVRRRRIERVYFERAAPSPQPEKE